MKPIRRLNVLPSLPEKLAPLWDLAHNLWWTWNPKTIRTLQQLDPETWIASGRDPQRFLASLPTQQLQKIADDETLSGHIAQVLEEFQQYQDAPTWFKSQHADSQMQVAYFSAEFGLSEGLRIYSGGLGVLAGDHLKAASDLGLPLVGVGLLYREGYFRQALNADGWQTERNPENDFYQMPIEPVNGEDGQQQVVEVPYTHGNVRARIWKVKVGRIALYLLDANIEENNSEDRQITARLYGGDSSMRIRQEILLGVGGLKALSTIGITPSVCHMNEGHSAFLALERIRLLMQEKGLSFAAAREASAVGNVFTTHTPVAAGNDWFSPDLVEHNLHPLREQLGLSREEFLGLGRIDPNDHQSDFCMTVLALKLSARANGVSRLHGEVSRQMWRSMWPDFAPSEVPISSITNGVHMQTWTALDIAELFERHLGEHWRTAQQDPQSWKGIHDISDHELWNTHQYRRQRLVDFSRFHLRNQFSSQGAPVAKTEQHLDRLNPHALTIGFARRFATYKRGTLIFRDLERLAALFADSDRPLQIIFAGKAHPQDTPGKELIRDIVHLARQEPFNGHVFFLQDYDMNVARYLVQGCDIWLNNPRRPMEASGTSGMKAAINGVLNVSVLDGWWEEACEMHSGWTIGLGENYEDEAYQDEVESNALYDLLETEVIPLFYQRDGEGLPRGWVARMKETIATLAPFFNTHRMVREYAENMYLPNYKRWQLFEGDNGRVEQLTQWKSHVRSKWPQVRIVNIEADFPTPLKVGTQIPISASLALGDLAPQDVRVELYAGRLNAQQEFIQAYIQPLEFSDSRDGEHLFKGIFTCAEAGSHGYTLRVLPYHNDLRNSLETGLIHWAQ
ncbi:MAG: starch phosphorylase [Candidatus Latescibacterota bacterium]|jgi:starch phosphorylase